MCARGLGLHFIRESMDTVEFSRRKGRNQLAGEDLHGPQKALEENPTCRLPRAIWTRLRFSIFGRHRSGDFTVLRKALLREVSRTEVPRVVLNLGAVRYMDSSGVASLVEGSKRRAMSFAFILFGLNRTIREVLQLSKLVKIFEDLRERRAIRGA